MMKLLCLFLLSLCVSAGAHPKGLKDSLSDKEHESGESHDHNPEYDHDAFLGQDEAKVYDELTPDESKEKLGELFHKVDEQGTEDGFVSPEELEKWIEFTQRRYIRDDSERHLAQNDLDGDGVVSWEEYKNATYGTLHENQQKRYAATMARDEGRFKLADRGKDLKLDLDEYIVFLHPEKHAHMRELIVNETLHDLDTDKDELISMDEYIGEWTEEERAKGVEPEWMKGEQAQFTETYDKNKDGKMDREEVRAWIVPHDHDQVSKEAKHLVNESDSNGDGLISKEEMLDKFDLFVGSQATNYGDLVKDEL